VLAPPLALALCLAAPSAPQTHEGRPILSGPVLTRLSADGRVKVHYTLEGADALPHERDEDPANGVPDVIDWTLEGAARMLGVFVDEDGWAAPPSDEGRGGDDRLDIYLRRIDANGYAYWQLLPSGRRAGYIEVAPDGATSYSKEAFQSIVGHEVHHILEFTTGGAGLATWILEATATWAQYLVFTGDLQVEYAQGVLWFLRLQQPSRALDDFGELFEYAGLVWLKFLVDRGGGDRRLVLDLWRRIGEEHSWVRGHDAFVRERLPGLASLGDAAAEFAVWNAFACSNDDGRHYAPAPGACSLGGRVPLMPLAPGGTVTSGRIGSRGSAYLAVQPDCASADLRLAVVATAPMRLHALGVFPRGESDVFVRDAAAGEEVTLDVPAWNQYQRVTLVGTNLGANGATFTATAAVSGAGGPPPRTPSPGALSVTPEAALTLGEGEEALLSALATYDTCEDGRDVTATVSWHSSDETVARVAAGRVLAMGPGSAMVVAVAGEVTSLPVEVTVHAAPGSGCALAGGAPGGAALVLLALWLARRRLRMGSTP
jgi:hypothetical protein